MTDDPFLAPPPMAGQPSPPLGDVPVPYQPPPVPPAPPQYEPQPAQYSPGAQPAQYAPGAQPPVPPPYGQAPYAQQGYPPPPPMGYPGQPKPKTWMNWVAFGCGLGALVTCVSFIPAIIFGHLGLAAAKRGEADQKGVGIAGLVLGYVFLVVAIAYVGIIAATFSTQ